MFSETDIAMLVSVVDTIFGTFDIRDIMQKVDTPF